MKTKKCSRCKKQKALSEFYKDKSHKYGYRSMCKSCDKERLKSLVKANPQKYKTLAKNWRDNNKDKVKSYQLKFKYGLSIDEYNKMFEEQQGKCAICCSFISNLDKSNKPAVVDHCHTTGKVRGLLCMQCNSLLGYAYDNIQILENAIKYLNQTKK